MSPDCRYLQTTVYFTIGEEHFSTTGKTLIDAGYTRVVQWQALAADETVPDFKKGDVCSVTEVNELFTH